MPDFPNLIISAWRINRLNDNCYRVSFDYNYTGGAGTCGDVTCEGADAMMTYTKQMANNEWPS